MHFYLLLSVSACFCFFIDFDGVILCDIFSVGIQSGLAWSYILAGLPEKKKEKELTKLNIPTPLSLHTTK